MRLGERIELRRIKVGISQAELARRVGVRQSTINSLINGDSRSSRSLHKIARELRTTPAYLVGETDDPDDEGADHSDYTSDQREIAELYARMTPADRRALIQIARSMGQAGGADETVHERHGDFRGKEGNG